MSLLFDLTWPIRLPFLFVASIRENRAFRGDIATAWAYCESVWDKPFVHAWQRFIHTPFRPAPPAPSRLIRRIMETFPESTEFLIGKARSPNPVIAAYAVQCLPHPNLLPSDVVARKETIALRDWFHEVTMPLGDWAQQLIDDEIRAAKWLDGQIANHNAVDTSGGSGGL